MIFPTDLYWAMTDAGLYVPKRQMKQWEKDPPSMTVFASLNIGLCNPYTNMCMSNPHTRLKDMFFELIFGEYLSSKSTKNKEFDI